jgi:formylglycine-generating enzyme required for sulfatase activity
MIKMKRGIIFGLLGAAAGILAAPTISNVNASQRDGSNVVDLYYDLCGVIDGASVSVELSGNSGSTYSPLTNSITGDFGENIDNGSRKHIVWNAGINFPETFSDTMRFRVTASEEDPIPSGMVRIPGGTNSGVDPDFGSYSLTVESFYMDVTEVTKAQWDTVFAWALSNGYGFSNRGSGKSSSHPVHTINWYDCVKWCNARSEKEGRTPCYMIGDDVYRVGQYTPECDFSINGYRLPTNDEWEFAARGGLSGNRFPWGNTISHSKANYFGSSDAVSYDSSYLLHPTYFYGEPPFTCPVGSFAPNGYGLYNMAGNVSEWCWDSTGSDRKFLGGNWNYSSGSARCGYENGDYPYVEADLLGFRTVCR